MQARGWSRGQDASAVEGHWCARWASRVGSWPRKLRRKLSEMHTDWATEVAHETGAGERPATGRPGRQGFAWGARQHVGGRAGEVLRQLGAGVPDGRLVPGAGGGKEGDEHAPPAMPEVLSRQGCASGRAVPQPGYRGGGQADDPRKEQVVGNP